MSYPTLVPFLNMFSIKEPKLFGGAGSGTGYTP